MEPLTIFGIIVYIVFIFISINVDRVTDVEFHEGGFLNMGYTTNSTREPTTKDVWLAIIWPLRFIIFLTKGILWIINDDVISIICLLVGYKYKNTSLYSYLERHLS